MNKKRFKAVVMYLYDFITIASKTSLRQTFETIARVRFSVKLRTTKKIEGLVQKM